MLLLRMEESQELTDRMFLISQRLRERLDNELPLQWVDKEDDFLCQQISKALDVAATVKQVMQMFNVDIPLAAPDGRRFQEDFATTVKQRVATPRAWRQKTPFGIRAALRTNAHEWQHGFQDHVGVKAGRWPKMLSHSVLYLAGCLAHTKDGEEYLAKVEGDAYAVTQYCVAWFCGRPDPIEGPLSSIRTAYNLLDVGPTMAEDVLKSHYETMRVGAIPPVTAARICRDVFYEHAGDLRGRVLV